MVEVMEMIMELEFGTIGSLFNYSLSITEEHIHLTINYFSFPFSFMTSYKLRMWFQHGAAVSNNMQAL